MYGLVNKAIEDLVVTQFGATVWDEVRRVAGVDDVFIGMQAYPDDITYRLVAAASAVTGRPAEELLEAFGEFWTLYTAREGYGELLKMGGSTFREFVLNLDNLHTHVALSFRELRPPTFWCTDVTDTAMRLHYGSTRAGLAPMVIGLVKGLGRMFDTPVTISHDRRRDDGADHDEFVLRFA